MLETWLFQYLTCSFLAIFFHAYRFPKRNVWLSVFFSTLAILIMVSFFQLFCHTLYFLVFGLDFTNHPVIYRLDLSSLLLVYYYLLDNIPWIISLSFGYIFVHIYMSLLFKNIMCMCTFICLCCLITSEYILFICSIFLFLPILRHIFQI